MEYLKNGIFKEVIKDGKPGRRAALLMRLAKWEYIRKINIDIDKNKLISFKFKTRTIFLDQYYHSKDVDEISEYLQLRTKDH